MKIISLGHQIFMKEMLILSKNLSEEAHIF